MKIIEKNIGNCYYWSISDYYAVRLRKLKKAMKNCIPIENKS